MRTIILEGTSTSGKTTIAKKLTEALRGKQIKYKVLEESRTLLPYLDSPDIDKSLNALHDLLDELESEEYEVVIIDRLYFTHVLINNSTLEKFAGIEKRLLPFNPIIIFLKMDEKVIKDRVLEAIKHRGKSWEEHVMPKGTDEQIEEWYIGTQRKLEVLYNETTLPKMTFDTTDKKFEVLTQKLLSDVLGLQNMR